MGWIPRYGQLSWKRGHGDLQFCKLGLSGDSLEDLPRNKLGGGGWSYRDHISVGPSGSNGGRVFSL